MHPEGKHAIALSKPAERCIGAFLCRLDQSGKGARLASVALDGKKLAPDSRKLDWPRRCGPPPEGFKF